MVDTEKPKQAPAPKQDEPAQPPPIKPDPVTQQIFKESKDPPKIGAQVYVVQETKEKP